MNVRIDYEGGAPKPRRVSTSGPAGPGRPPRKRKRKDLVLFGAVGAGVLALVVAIATSGGNDTNDETPPAPSTSVGMPAPATDAPGLTRGKATAAGVLGTRRLSGVPRGFPKTADGAVESVTTGAAQNYGILRMTKEDRTALLRAAYVHPPDLESQASAWRAQNNLNDAGQLMDPATGLASSERRFTSLCHPEEGAFKLESFTGTEASVTVWEVCITGVISPVKPNNLSVEWSLARFDLTWVGDDWKINAVGGGSYTLPTLANPGTAAPSYQERARALAALGTGWNLYADASATMPAELQEAQK